MQDASVTCLFPLPIWVAYFQRELSLTPALSLWERESVPPLLAGEGLQGEGKQTGPTHGSAPTVM